MSDVLHQAGQVAESLAFGEKPGQGLPQLPPAGARARGGYDHLIDAANRLPRPLAALLAIGLFLDAALNPQGFAQRMEALATVPEPLWWLLGAVLTAFFGAREAHYLRRGGAGDRR